MCERGNKEGGRGEREYEKSQNRGTIYQSPASSGEFRDQGSGQPGKIYQSGEQIGI